MRIAIFLVVAFTVATGAAAQDDVRAAAQAFEQGQRAQLRGEYAQAARFFEIAHRAAPAAAAMRSAIRNHQAAGALARAATLSAVAAGAYSDDAETQALVVSVLAEADASLGRADVACSAPCSLTVDGHLVTLAEGRSFRVYIQPGAHELSARFETGEIGDSFEVAAGATISRELTAPTPEPEPVVEPVEPIEPVEPPEPMPLVEEEPTEPTESRGGLSPVVTYVGAGVTAGLLGAFIWSLVDTGNASDDYKANPTRAGFDDGRGRVVRTGVLGAVAGAAGVATIIIAVAATNWGDGDDDRALLPSVWADGGGGGLALSGRLGAAR